MGRRKQRDKRTLKKIYLVYVDGECEIIYLHSFNSRYSPIKILPQLPNNKALEKQFQDIKDLVEEQSYEKIFWLIDGDQIIHNGEISKLKQIYHQVSNSKLFVNKVEILINNPCLEFWFLLHFKFSTKNYISCDQVVRDLKSIPQDCEISDERLENILKSYSKKHRVISELSELLKSYLKSAIENAERISDFDFENPNSCAEIYKFFKEIGISS